MTESSGVPAGESSTASRCVFVAGHRGMVGQALVRALRADPTVVLVLRPRAELDLADACAVDAFFAANRIDEVYLAAAKVGGIVANDAFPVNFLAENLVIQHNVIGAAHAHGVDRLLFSRQLVHLPEARHAADR